MNIILISVLVIVLVIVIAILFTSVAIIHTGEVGIVERLGKYVATLEPGFHVVPPFIYRITEIVNMKQIPLKVDEQEVITKDNVVVRISETLKYHITDVNAYVYQNKDSVLSMVQDTRANLRGIIGNMDLNDVLNGTETINQTLFQQIAETTAGYGLNVDRVNIDSRKIKAYEVHDLGIGRNAEELLRKVQAAQYVEEHGEQVCPAKWKPGEETLMPSLDLVGML